MEEKPSQRKVVRMCTGPIVTKDKKLKKAYIHIINLLTLLCFLSGNGHLMAQTNHRDFPPSRLQSNQGQWKYAEGEYARLYFNMAEEELIRDLDKRLSDFYRNLIPLTNYKPQEELALYVFAHPFEYAQSNMGLLDSDWPAGGRNLFQKHYAELVHSANRAALYRSMREAVAQKFVHDMFFGGNFKVKVKNNYLLNLPEWYTEGLIYFLAHGYDPKAQQDFLLQVKSRDIKHPQYLTGRRARIVGVAIWAYLQQRFGEDKVQEILTYTRVLRERKYAFTMALDKDYDRVLEDWRASVLEVHKPANHAAKAFSVPKDAFGFKVVAGVNDQIVYQEETAFKASVIRENTSGRKVELYEAKKSKRQFKSPYPLLELASAENNRVLIIDRSKANRTSLLMVDSMGLELAEWKVPFVYTVANAHYLDGQLQFLGTKNGKEGLFALGRGKPVETLYTSEWPMLCSSSDARFLLGAYDDSRYWLHDRKKDTLIKFSSIADPLVFGDQLLYDPGLSAGSMRLLMDLEDYQLRRIQWTSEDRLLVEQDSGLFRQKLYSTLHKGNLYAQISDAMQVVSKLKGKAGSHTSPAIEGGAKHAEDSIRSFEDWYYEEALGRAEHNIYDFAFEEKQNIETPRVISTGFKKLDSLKKKHKAAVSPTKPVVVEKEASELEISQAREQLFLNYFTFSPMHFSPLRHWGLLVEVDLSTEQDNHHFYGRAVGYQLDLKSFETQLNYDYLAKRLDMGVQFKQSNFYLVDATRNWEENLQFYQLRGRLAYPLTKHWSAEAQPFFTRVRNTHLPFEGPLSGPPDQIQHIPGLHLQLKFDNTRMREVNILNGSRLELSGTLYAHEYHAARFAQIRGSAQHYEGLWRTLTLAASLDYGAFLGVEPKNFLLGGVNNWVRSYEGILHESSKSNDPIFGFATDRTDWFFNEFIPMRGFPFNQTFGQQFLKSALELRMPLKAVIPWLRPRGTFWNTLQINAFAESAIVGDESLSFSYSKVEQTIQTNQGSGSPFLIRNNYYKNPNILASYGLGLRATVLKYFTRLDYSIPYYRLEARDPQIQVSIGYDF